MLRTPTASPTPPKPIDTTTTEYQQYSVYLEEIAQLAPLEPKTDDMCRRSMLILQELIVLYSAIFQDVGNITFCQNAVELYNRIVVKTDEDHRNIASINNAIAICLENTQGNPEQVLHHYFWAIQTLGFVQDMTKNDAHNATLCLGNYAYYLNNQLSPTLPSHWFKFFMAQVAVFLPYTLRINELDPDHFVSYYKICFCLKSLGHLSLATQFAFIALKSLAKQAPGSFGRPCFQFMKDIYQFLSEQFTPQMIDRHFYGFAHALLSSTTMEPARLLNEMHSYTTALYANSSNKRLLHDLHFS